MSLSRAAVAIPSFISFVTMSRTAVLTTPLRLMPSICSGVFMRLRLGTLCPFRCAAKIFLSISVGSCPFGTDHLVLAIVLCFYPLLNFKNSLYTSPIISTTDVPTMIYIQSLNDIGVTLNILPPKLTINICPIIITKAISMKL